ncbi:membrane protein [Spirosoma luteolum]
MAAAYWQILGFAPLPALALGAGGLIASYVQLTVKLQSAVLHFAAGVIFSVVAVEILPHIITLHNPAITVAGFGAGIGLMLLIRRFTEKTETPADGERAVVPVALLVVLGIDVVIDGLLLGIGFAAGAQEGKLLAYALAIESVSVGLATATTLTKNNLSRARVLRVILGLVGLFLVSSVLGATLLQNLPETQMDVVLSFGLAALLFLVTEELLTEAHIAEEPAWLTGTFYAGFLLFLLLGMVD